MVVRTVEKKEKRKVGL
jgi:hypothetical protein